MSRRVGYACLGRTMKFDATRHGFQGDAEKPNLLRRLATRSPDVEWVLVGHNDAGERPLGLPNVTNPWFGARERATTLPPRTDGFYRTPFAPYWTNSPSWWCSEVSGFEDELVELIGDLDGVVIHVGQHAPTQLRIPQANRTWHETFTDPGLDGNKVYDSMQSYCRYLVRGLNTLGDRTVGQAPVVWLVPDPRNYLKARDVKWHTGTDELLSQYQFTRRQRHERYLDPRLPAELATAYGVELPDVELDRDGELWVATHHYRHADLELMILPDDWDRYGAVPFVDRGPAGVATTSTKASVLGEGRRRSRLVHDYLLAAFPEAEVYGKWDAASLADVPDDTVRSTTPDEFHGLLERWRVTVSLPIVESGWSVAKAYQCWAANTVCFYVEQVDDQGWTLPSRRPAPGTTQVGDYHGPLYSVRDDWTDADLALAAWLRVETPEEFRDRAAQVVRHERTWRWLVDAQRDLLDRRWLDRFLERTIEERLFGDR